MMEGRTDGEPGTAERLENAKKSWLRLGKGREKNRIGSWRKANAMSGNQIVGNDVISEDYERWLLQWHARSHSCRTVFAW